MHARISHSAPARCRLHARRELHGARWVVSCILTRRNGNRNYTSAPLRAVARGMPDYQGVEKGGT